MFLETSSQPKATLQLSVEEVLRQVRAAAESLCADLTRAEQAADGWQNQELGYALVETALDRCLATLSATGCWGKDNQIPSGELWRVAGTWLETGSLQWRARAKPRGYAGDFELFAQIIDGHLAPHPLGRLFDRYFQSQAAVEAVRNRTRQIAAAIASRAVERSAAQRGERPFRVVSVGCGPAIDLEWALRWLPEPSRRDWHATLLDLDADALQAAREGLTGLLAPDRLTCLRENLYRLADKPGAAALLEGADILVCAGLFDYLGDEAAERLLRAFWERLGPGGLLLVGNFAPHNPTRAYMEWIGNWYLTYRAPDELSRLAARAGIPAACCHIAAERLGIDCFLVAERAPRAFVPEP